MKTFGNVAARAIRSASGRADSRGRLVKAVRAACRRLGIDDDDRRALQLEVTGQASLSDMNLAELGRLLDQLNKDWKGPMGHRAYVAKIRALWWTLYWTGVADDPKEPALDAFVRRQTGKASIRFLGHKEAFRVIEALKSWAAREGVAWPAQADLDRLLPANPDLTLPRLERHAVLDAIAVRLREAGALHAGWIGWCEKALFLSCNHLTWTERELDACIRALGKKLRRALDKRGGQ